MRLLDLCCGVGAVSVGYARAGWEVVGVDIDPQPDYPFEFYQMDALKVLQGDLRGIDAVHMSWPCQGYCTLTKGTNVRMNLDHPRLIEPGRELAEATGLPYVMENVDAAPLRRDVVLCGEMFNLKVLRHRVFELGGWSMPQPVHKPHRGLVRGYGRGGYQKGYYYPVYGNGGGKGTTAEWRMAMGIDWTWNRQSIAEAVPPAYTELIGKALLEHLEGSK